MKDANWRKHKAAHAHKELIQTPLFVLDIWKEVLMTDGESLFDIQNVEALYKAVPNPRSVLRRLEFPEVLMQEEATLKYSWNDTFGRLMSGNKSYCYAFVQDTTY